MVKRTPITVNTKLKIAREAISSGLIKETARNFDVSAKQVRNYKRQIKDLTAAAEKRQGAFTIHSGPPVLHASVKNELLAWISNLRKDDITISTSQLICKALSIEPAFHGGREKALWRWAYQFYKRNKLSIRRVTHEGQKLSAMLGAGKAEFNAMVNARFKSGGSLCGISAKFVANMDETAVFFECKSKTTIHFRGANTVAARCSGSNNNRMTVCVTCLADGSKLPLFVVFKAKPDGKIEKRLQEILPDGMFGCCQTDGWMDERGCRIWLEQVWKPHAVQANRSYLLLDEFKAHMQNVFVDKVNDLGTEVDFIPGGFTSVLQPCDVAVNKPFKGHIKSSYMNWCVRKYKNIGEQRIPFPKREDVLAWTANSWELIPRSTILKSFRACGYDIPNYDIDISKEAESIRQDVAEELTHIGMELDDLNEKENLILNYDTTIEELKDYAIV